LSSPDGSFFSVLDGGIVGTNSGFGAGGAISGASLTTTDGGLTLSSTGLLQIQTDGLVGTTLPGLTEVFRITPKGNGGGAGTSLSHYTNADGSEWKWDIAGVANANQDGFEVVSGVTFQGAVLVPNSGITALGLLCQDGSDFVNIDATGIQANVPIESSSLTITGGPTLTSTNFASGAYTPTVSAGVNVGSTANVSGYYTRAGSNIIAGSVRLTITPTLGIATSFELSLPVASAFSTARQAIGSGTFQGAVNQPVFVSSSAANDTLVVSFLSDVTAVAKELTINFQYEKI